MAYELARIHSELLEAGVPPAFPLPVAIAIVSDTFRLAGLAPPRATEWSRRSSKLGHLAEQAAFLAHVLASTSLRAQAVDEIKATRVDPGPALWSFFEAVAPLTGEMLRTNRFRQEEFLRRFIASLGGSVAGESAGQSEKKLDQLDYRKTLAEFDKVGEARQKEAARRAQLLREAAQREEYAKGWRE
jgi:hypothetical protein